MDRNLIYFIVGALMVAVAVLSYQHYEDQRRGLRITIGPNGASVHSQ
jgi:hypothetical protein